ncbi:MAG: hypothetical protein ACR5LF_08330 [Symbiopectobacterium sp.]
MATIIYRKCVNPVNKTNAAICRHARRKTEAIRRELVTSRIDNVLGQKPERRKALNRIELAFKRKRAPQINFGILARFRKQINHFAEMYDMVKRCTTWLSVLAIASGTASQKRSMALLPEQGRHINLAALGNTQRKRIIFNI